MAFRPIISIKIWRKEMVTSIASWKVMIRIASWGLCEQKSSFQTIGIVWSLNKGSELWCNCICNAKKWKRQPAAWGWRGWDNFKGCVWLAIFLSYVTAGYTKPGRLSCVVIVILLMEMNHCISWHDWWRGRSLPRRTHCEFCTFNGAGSTTKIVPLILKTQSGPGPEFCITNHLNLTSLPVDIRTRPALRLGTCWPF